MSERESKQVFERESKQVLERESKKVLERESKTKVRSWSPDHELYNSFSLRIAVFIVPV